LLFLRLLFRFISTTFVDITGSWSEEGLTCLDVDATGAMIRGLSTLRWLVLKLAIVDYGNAFRNFFHNFICFGMRVIAHIATVALPHKIGHGCLKFNCIFRHINASGVELAATKSCTTNHLKAFSFSLRTRIRRHSEKLSLVDTSADQRNDFFLFLLRKKISESVNINIAAHVEFPRDQTSSF